MPGPSSLFFQAEDGIRDVAVTGVQTCALPILLPIAAWLMRLPESLASLSIQQPFLSNLFDFVWDVRNNYFMRLGLTVVFTFILLVVTVLAAPLFFYFLSLPWRLTSPCYNLG